MKTLKEAREEKGIKLGAVAEAVGVTRQTYSSYEKNQDSMNVIQARAACDFLGVQFEEIFLHENVSISNQQQPTRRF